MASLALRVLNKIKHHPKIGLVILAYVAFIALGVAWPSIRSTFSIPLDAVGLLITCSVAGFMTSTFLSGPLVAVVFLALLGLYRWSMISRKVQSKNR